MSAVLKPLRERVSNAQWVERGASATRYSGGGRRARL